MAIRHGVASFFATAPQPAASSRCCRIVFHAGSPAQRQLFRTDFRFAPSPRRASLAGPPIHVTRDMVVHGLCGRVPDSAGNVSSWIASAQTDANLSAHLHRLPTPPPYLRQMRLSPGRGRRYPMGDKAVAWPDAAFLQITARANPCPRPLWGTLARSVASI